MSVSASWIQLTEIPVGDRSKFYYFRRHELFPYVQWIDEKTKAPIPDIVDCLIAGAPYGGPVAMISGKVGVDVVKEETNQEGVGYQQIINVYDAAGKPISVIKLNKNEAAVVNMGWTNDMKLVVLTQAGRLHIFNVHGERFHHHSWAAPDKKTEKLKEEKKKGETENQPESNVIATYLQAPLNEKEYVINSKMFEEGCAILTDSNRLFLIDDFVNFVNNTPFQELESQELALVSTTAMEVLPRQYSGSDRTQVILGMSEEPSVLVLSSGKNPRDPFVKKLLTSNDSSGFVKLQFGPDKQTLSAYSRDHGGRLNVFNSALTANLLQFECRGEVVQDIKPINNDDTKEPDEIVYCGNECIMLYWRPNSIRDGDDTSLLIMIDCYGEYEHFTYEGSLHLIQECDSVRVLTNNMVELFERVPDSTVEVFRIGSLESSALLYDAYMDYKHNRSTSIKTIRDIRYNKSRDTSSQQNDGSQTNDNETVEENANDDENEDGEADDENLRQACFVLVDAACREILDVNLQQQLLSAATYGRTFLKAKSRVGLGKRGHANDFMQRCKEIRVLNEVRRLANMPLTYQQFQQLTAPVLIARLSELHCHFLATKICEYLGIKSYNVLVHWACTKAKMVANSTGDDKDDDEILKVINGQLLPHKEHVSYAKIAMQAFQSGKKRLAKMLLKEDTNAAEQIPLYLSMHETNEAIDRAISSNDSDLMYMIVLYMMRFFEPEYMYEIISKKPQVQILFESYCRSRGKHRRIEKLYAFLGNHVEAGYASLSCAYKYYENEEEKEGENDKRFAGWLERAEQHFSKGYKSMDQKLSLKQRELLAMQIKLQEDFKEQFVGGTIHDTLYKVMAADVKKISDKEKKDILKKIKEQFQVSDKRYWTVKVKALGDTQMWDALLKFAQEKTSPIGYEPFVDACLKSNRIPEAVKCIQMISNPEIKINYYVDLVKFKEAIEVAVAANSVELLEKIKKKTTNSKTMDTIEKLIHDMTGK